MNFEEKNFIEELNVWKFFNFCEEARRKDSTLLNTQILYENPCLLFSFGRLLAKKILYDPIIKGKKVALIGVPEAGTVFSIAAIMSVPELIHNFSFHILRSKIKKSPPFKNHLLMTDSKRIGSKVPVLVDDFLAHGFSKIQALRVCNNEGVAIEKIFTLFDFGYGGFERLAKSDYSVTVDSIFNILGVAWHLCTKELISLAEYEGTKAFIQHEINAVRLEEQKLQENQANLGDRDFLVHG